MTTLAVRSSLLSELLPFIDHLVAKINDSASLSKEEKDEWEYVGYFETLKRINDFTKPFLYTVSSHAGIDLLEAWPTGRCESFVFASVVNKKIAYITLARNKERGFLQHGAAEAEWTEDCSSYKVIQVAREEFNFHGSSDQIRYLNCESENGSSISHFVRGVSVVLITPDQDVQLKLTNRETNEIISIPVEEFLNMTDRETNPVDYGFDRKHIARFIRDYNDLKRHEDYQFMETTDQDCRIAQEAKKWIESIRVSRGDIIRINELFDDLNNSELINLALQGEKIVKSLEEFDAIMGALQKVVDTVVSKLLPPWDCQGMNGVETACQVKVQKAAGVFVNGNPLPSFLTIPQMFAMENNLTEGEHRFSVVEFDRRGHAMHKEPAKSTESVSDIILRICASIEKINHSKSVPDPLKPKYVPHPFEYVRNIKVFPV